MTGWTPGGAIEAAQKCFLSWLEYYGTGDREAAALKTETTWRPQNPFFLRSHILDASMNEICEAYDRVIGYVKSGHDPAQAIQYVSITNRQPVGITVSFFYEPHSGVSFRKLYRSISGAIMLP